MKKMNEATMRTVDGGNWKCSVCKANYPGGLIGYILCQNHCGQKHWDLWGKNPAHPVFEW